MTTTTPNQAPNPAAQFTDAEIQAAIALGTAALVDLHKYLVDITTQVGALIQEQQAAAATSAGDDTRAS